MAKLVQLAKKPAEKVESDLPVPTKSKKVERKLIRKISTDSDTSEDLIPPNPPESESVFLKSLSALRDNVLTPAEDGAVHQAGRLLGAMGIVDSDSDFGFYLIIYFLKLKFIF